LLSFWLYVFGGILAIASLFAGGGMPDTGWTFYVPFSTQTKTNVSMATFAAFILGMSSILTGVNFVTTVHRLRAHSMGWKKIPLFTWSLYATAWVQILATPVVGMTLLLIILERAFGIGLFDPNKGGDPVLYQHLFWMYSHPAVYIMVLPAMGVISDIIPTFARKSIFGYKAIVGSSLGIAIAGSLVWAHHMYTSSMSDAAVFLFSFLTFIVAVPSAVKVFNWLATLQGGSIVMAPPLAMALVFIVLFSVGGLTGLVLGAVGPNVHVHDTAFVVAHFHFVMFGGVGVAFLAALHYWWPKMFGRMYAYKPAYWGLGIFFVGFNLHYVTMFILGLQGMPRRYYTYVEKFAVGNFFAGIAAVVMVFGMGMIFWNLLRSLRRPMGGTALDNPWGAVTLEWQSPSPPPLENFVKAPSVPDYPYDFPIEPGAMPCEKEGGKL
jgi:cytochrome c oxidase subunit 1